MYIYIYIYIYIVYSKKNIELCTKNLFIFKNKRNAGQLPVNPAEYMSMHLYIYLCTIYIYINVQKIYPCTKRRKCRTTTRESGWINISIHICVHMCISMYIVVHLSPETFLAKSRQNLWEMHVYLYMCIYTSVYMCVYI